jgi:hypothetical protein
MNSKVFGHIVAGLVAIGCLGANAADFIVTCTIDRSTVVPPIPSKNQILTLKLRVGDATSADVLVDGQPAVSRIDSKTKCLLVTTTGSSIEAHVFGASSQSQIGTFKKTPLKDDMQWAWSHGFDDNRTFLEHSTEVFNLYGWAGTLFLIGQNISADSVYLGKEIWDQVTDAHMRRLHKLGWAMGNHSWAHTGGDTEGEITKCQDRILQALAPTDPSYLPMAFAGPMFSQDYDNHVHDIRDNHPEIGLKFVEGGGNPPTSVLVDSGGTVPMWPSWSVGAFNANNSIGRDAHINCFKSCGPEGWNNFLWYIDSITMHADSMHHYWFNTFEHGSDGVFNNTDPSDDSSGIVGFVPWLYNHYGPGGDNTVWVAPSEQIWCYTVTQQTAKLTATVVVPSTGTATRYAVKDGNRMVGHSMANRTIKNMGLKSGAQAYDLRGHRLSSRNIRGTSLIIIR